MCSGFLSSLADFICGGFCVLGLEQIVRLLKSKGIHMHRAQTHLRAKETTKQRLYVKYERRKKQQTERHVLRKEMADHACPLLFVSRRSDKSPNGFN